ncbi:hypothetical protein [uncultured Adlercreutzia sp.]|uniref:hypothetical protein n=1 Tax=uncultured Adlercreutzia sp. TaxID=875803 RepID=UPI0025E97356|nr:hypothetical protein [uncultured Adlercreutzia sp.]
MAAQLKLGDRSCPTPFSFGKLLTHLELFFQSDSYQKTETAQTMGLAKQTMFGNRTIRPSTPLKDSFKSLRRTESKRGRARGTLFANRRPDILQQDTHHAHQPKLSQPKCHGSSEHYPQSNPIGGENGNLKRAT